MVLKKIFYLIILIILIIPIIVFSQSDSTSDIISLIKTNNPDLYKNLGLNKLSDEEISNLNIFINDIFLLGVDEGSKQIEKENNTFSTINSSNKAFISKIYEENDDVLELENGAIIEITYGYIGYIGYRKDCVLYKSGSQWKIWIEGKKSFICDILKYPQYASSVCVEEVFINEVKADGKILLLSDGSIYEVSDLNTLETSLWMGISDAILIDQSQIINLDSGGEIVDVFKIK